jgi:DNA-binding transcriptional MerR regulator
MKLDDLAAATGATVRQIRFLIGEGFVPPPEGGRTYARYGDAHVKAIRRFQRLKDLGFPNAAIRLLLDAREGVPVPVVDGVTLVIAPELLGSDAAVDQIVERTEARLRAALSGGAPKPRRRAAAGAEG